MKMSDSIGLELERREKILHESLECGHDLVEEQPCAQCRLEARIEALEAAATDVVECGVDAMAYDRRQVLDALAALLEATTDRRAG